MAQLGIPIRDAEFFDIATYIELIDIQANIMKKTTGERKANQKDIDLFLL